MQHKFVAFWALAAALFVGACAETGSRQEPAAEGAGAGQPTGARGAAVGAPSRNRLLFDFESSELKPAAVQILTQWAEYLSAHPQVSVTLEGHCDERGSPDYNIGLGERRAISAKSALVAKGVSPDRITVISYGEERPVAAGHNESAWSKNRRVEIVVH